MSAAAKGFYFRRLKAAGVPLDRHFRDYTTDELKAADAMAIENGLLAPPTEEAPSAVVPDSAARARNPRRSR